MLSRARLFATPWTVACQAPLSIEFSRQEYWSRLPFPSPKEIENIFNCTYLHIHHFPHTSFLCTDPDFHLVLFSFNLGTSCNISYSITLLVMNSLIFFNVKDSYLKDIFHGMELYFKYIMPLACIVSKQKSEVIFIYSFVLNIRFSSLMAFKIIFYHWL